MNRSEKAQVVQELNQALQKSPHVLLTTFRGLSVNQSTELRRRIRSVGGHYGVIKNRLARRAVKDTAAERLHERFAGPCALATHETDPVGLAKALAEFAKDNPQIEMLAGIVDAQDLIDAEGVKQLAKLPALPELRAQLLSLVQAPATSLVRLLQTPGGQLARVIDARREAQGGGAEDKDAD